MPDRRGSPLECERVLNPGDGECEDFDKAGLLEQAKRVLRVHRRAPPGDKGRGPVRHPVLGWGGLKFRPEAAGGLLIIPEAGGCEGGPIGSAAVSSSGFEGMAPHGSHADEVATPRAYEIFDFGNHAALRGCGHGFVQRSGLQHLCEARGALPHEGRRLRPAQPGLQSLGAGCGPLRARGGKQSRGLRRGPDPWLEPLLRNDGQRPRMQTCGTSTRSRSWKLGGLPWRSWE